MDGSIEDTRVGALTSRPMAYDLIPMINREPPLGITHCQIALLDANH
ncbi:MAG: hypothetical protein ACR2PA_04490 [Hyphomicrobiaceae bacterium]